MGIDLHRRRTVLVRTSECGDELEARILNDVALAVMARAGQDPEVVLEATYGWYWAVDALPRRGARVHLAHPLGVKAFEYRRVKNDLLTELSGRSFGRCVRVRLGWLGSVLVINDGDVPRELSGLEVPLSGSLEATGDLFEPYRLVDGDGVVVDRRRRSSLSWRRVGGRRRRSVRMGWICCAGSGSCGRSGGLGSGDSGRGA